MIENLVIFLFGSFMVIGKLEGEMLYQPRTVHMIPDRSGRALIMLNPMVGKPEKIRVMDAQASYCVTDDEITKLYIQVTSGLTLVRNITDN